jgi:hypothetical protein
MHGPDRIVVYPDRRSIPEAILAGTFRRAIAPAGSVVAGYLFGRQEVPFWHLMPWLGYLNLCVAALFLWFLVDSALGNRPRRSAAYFYGLFLMCSDPVKFATSFADAAWAVVALSPLAAFAILYRDDRSWPLRVGASILLGTSTAALAYNTRSWLTGIGYFGAWLA